MRSTRSTSGAIRDGQRRRALGRRLRQFGLRMDQVFVGLRVLHKRRRGANVAREELRGFGS